MCVCVCVCVCVREREREREREHVCLCMHTCVHACLCDLFDSLGTVCVWIGQFVRLYKCMFVCFSVCVCGPCVHRLMFYVCESL